MVLASYSGIDLLLKVSAQPEVNVMSSYVK